MDNISYAMVTGFAIGLMIAFIAVFYGSSIADIWRKARKKKQMINVAFLCVPVRWLAALFSTKTNDLYTYTNAKGVTYFLHCRLMGKSNTVTYHFSQSSENALPSLPKGYEIKTFSNGVPYLTKVKDDGQYIHY